MLMNLIMTEVLPGAVPEFFRLMDRILWPKRSIKIREHRKILEFYFHAGSGDWGMVASEVHSCPGIWVRIRHCLILEKACTRQRKRVLVSALESSMHAHLLQ